jgi:succinate dehydrogenase / fumarate reductase flavoprotein subunit
MIGDSPIVDFQSEIIQCPVLIIGAGAAGARAAISLQSNGIEPLVVSKRDHGDAHTIWARGGINASLGNIEPDDSWEVHAADTIEEGHEINDPTAVEIVAKNMPERIKELDEWGMQFTRTSDELINQRFFGAQSFPRTCFAGDHTGESLLNTLVAKAQDLEIPYQDNVMITRLLTDGTRVYGAVGFDMETGSFMTFIAEFVVLAAGGNTSIYETHSSRDDENTADGAGLAYLAGAQLMDMEFIQFHPTGMVGYGDTWDGRLVTEAVRGDGGYLLNSDNERFMFEYSSLDRPELAARDVVARAITAEVDAGRGTENDGVYLDISHKNAEYIKTRLPRMYERFQSLGLDITNEPMEVAPTAHYSMGGVDFNPTTGETSIEKLHVIGESTAGVHGANRLGGNSLAETVAIGEIVGECISNHRPSTPDDLPPESVIEQAVTEFNRLTTATNTSGQHSINDIITELRSVVETYAGIERSEQTLKTGIEQLFSIKQKVSNVELPDDRSTEEFEFYINAEFMLIAAESVIRGSLKRAESRGAHYRSDVPQKQSEFRCNILYTQHSDESMGLETRTVPDIQPEVTDAIETEYEVQYHHLE